MSRAEWKVVWRWKRETEKRLRQYDEVILKSIQEMQIYGISALYYDEMLDNFVNPPWLITKEML